jgi:hypothetical protein
MRRFSSYEWVKTAPGISPTSPSGSNVLVSAFGAGVDQNQFLIDGTSVTATGNGVARADPGIDFIQELQIQSVGASVEYGNVQGAVVNVVTKSGSNRFQYDAAYYSQTAALTSQPVRRPYKEQETGYERARYRDFTTSLGGPVARDGCGSSPDTNVPRFRQSAGHRSGLSEETSRTRFAKLTWRLSDWQLVQSFHDELWSASKHRRRPSRSLRPSASRRRCQR